MNELLTKQLEQISSLISGLKGEGADLERLKELSRSLDVLGHQIKTNHLDGFPGNKVLSDYGIHQDAVFYYNIDFQMIRLAGAWNKITGNIEKNTLPDIKSLFTPEGFEEFADKTFRLLETNEPQAFKGEILSKSDILLPVHFLLEKIKLGNAVEGISAGMVYLNQTPSELENYRQILLENIPGIDLYLFDTTFRYIMAGGREKSSMGLTNSDFIGKKLFDVYNQKTVKRLFPFYRNALDGIESEGEVRIKGKVYLIQATPVFGLNNQIIGGALISQDVTIEKEIEKNLLTAKKEAEESNKAKTIFLANMSHEIRTPLNAIIGFSGLLSKTELDANQRKYAQMIRQSSEHLLSVVNEILFLFKYGMGKVYIEKTPFNIHELIAGVYESLSFRANEKNLTFQTDIGRNVGKIVVGDPFRVKQILMNLAGNAINFTEKGTVTIQVFREKLTRKDVFLRFDITDTGIGIPQADLEYIFDEFAQSSVSRKINNKGTGLGLTIVKKLVELLNGRLYVESTEGQGSKFTVVIPFIRPHLSENPVPARNYELKYNLLQGKKILYADDDKNNILLGESILQLWNVDYRIATDGGEALDFLQKEKFDIALLDIRMPVAKGTEVAQKIRKDRKSLNYATRMLAVTANIMDSDILEYLKSGFDGFILKPFDEEILYNKICNTLELEVKSTEEKPQLPQGKEKELQFDTTMLLKTTAGNTTFFNKMIDTFITNAKETQESFLELQKDQRWTEIGELAHKAIPSFSYFGLKEIVEKLSRLENMILRENKNNEVVPLATEVSGEIEKVLELAEKSRLEV